LGERAAQLRQPVSSPQKNSDKPLTPRHAWQPLTPRGVAAFVPATFTRLFFVQFIVAALFVLALLGFLRVSWLPVLTEAVRQLPETGEIRGGELDFPGSSPARLAENARLAVVVDVAAAGTTGRTADLEVTFQKNRVVVCGPIGCEWRVYPRHYIISFNRAEVEAAWGAWRWALITIVVVATMVTLLAGWWAMGLIYVPLVKVFTLFADRRITWAGAWRLSMAALLPGTLMVAAAILLYAFGTIDLFRLGLLYLLHFVAGLFFVITSPYFLPAVDPERPGRNPFGSASNTARPASPFSRRGDQ
jgi:hypothetical protein